MTRKEITKVVKYCCKKLDLPMIKINMLEDTWRLGNFHFDEGKVTLELNSDKIGRMDRREAYETVFKYVKHKQKFDWEIRFFIVAHELAHYMQYERHWMWLADHMREVEKYLNSYKRFSIKKYHSFKVEANANKVALILLKQAKREGFKI